MPKKPFTIGIDLHGTLLNREWTIPEELHNDLEGILEELKHSCRIYTCTGNDLTFARERIPPRIFRLFDGFVLETGCVISNGETEEILVRDRETLDFIKNLERELKEQEFRMVDFFARRLATISLFTQDPLGLQRIVQDHINKRGFGSRFNVLYSSVAVDIIPRGYDKYTGMKMVSRGTKIIGIADSMNDKDLLLNTDFAFMPSNAPSELLMLLKSGNRRILKLSGGMKRGVVMQSEKEETWGLLEILKSIYKNIRNINYDKNNGS